MEKIKRGAGFKLPQLHILPDDLFLGLTIILIAFGAFGLGRLSKIEGSKTPIRTENAIETTADTFAPQTTEAAPQISVPQTANAIRATEGQLVGSKIGKKYHYPWCSGASRIAEANRIYFSSKSDAEARGYTPASNCKGL